jgi:outer membrane protein TolC
MRIAHAFFYGHKLSVRSAMLAFAALVGLLSASPAYALQPLSEFVAAARRTSTDARQAALTTVQREAEAAVTRGQQLPSLVASGSYTLNQYDAVISSGQGSIVVQPHHGLSSSVQLSVPLIDVAGWRRAEAASTTARAAGLSAEATIVDVERQVAQYYFQLIGAEAVRRAYETTLKADEENYETARGKREEGAATDLDVARASVEVEGIKRNLADQQLTIALARRALTTLTGIVPSADVPDFDEDLHAETPLPSWEARIAKTPSVRQAREEMKAAEQQASAARLALLPTLAATATETATNAPGFVGHHAYFTGAVTATWRLDVPTLARRKSQQAAEDVSRVRAEGAENRARDAVHEAWQRIASGIVACGAARTQTSAARLAALTARERYAAGSGTQLELIQAERDLSNAEAARIQAAANLALARVLLRLASGEH